MTIEFNIDGNVAHLQINRPERRNAINFGLLEEISESVDQAIQAEVRAFIVSGAGEHFCAGADLSELEDQSFTVRLRDVLDRLAGMNAVTISAISGACMGLGMQLAMACDLRVAGHDAKFAVPVSKLGLMVDLWTVRKLAALAGHSTARQLLTTGMPIDVARAYQVGFVQHLVEDGSDPLGVAVSLAETVSALAPLSIVGSKLGLDLVERDPGSRSSEDEYRVAFDRAWSSADLVEGRVAFVERRPPEFNGN